MERLNGMKNDWNLGTDCGSVGGAVASDARGLRFESSHWQTFISDIYLFTVNCIEIGENKEKEADNSP